MKRLGIKINPKQNVLSEFKILSRDSVSHIPKEIHTCIRIFPQATTRYCHQYFETADHSRTSHVTIKGVEMQMEEPRYLMSVMTL